MTYTAKILALIAGTIVSLAMVTAHAADPDDQTFRGLWGCGSPIIAHNFWQDIIDLANNKGVKLTHEITRQIAEKNGCNKIEATDLRDLKIVSALEWSLEVSNGTVKGWVSPFYWVTVQNTLCQNKTGKPCP